MFLSTLVKASDKYPVFIQSLTTALVTLSSSVADELNISTNFETLISLEATLAACDPKGIRAAAQLSPSPIVLISPEAAISPVCTPAPTVDTAKPAHIGAVSGSSSETPISAIVATHPRIESQGE